MPFIIICVDVSFLKPEDWALTTKVSPISSDLSIFLFQKSILMLFLGLFLYIFDFFIKILLIFPGYGHKFLKGQIQHLGATGLHIYYPNPTRSLFISAQYFLGSQDSKSFLVASGFFVGYLTQLSRFEILCTWVSTPIPSILPKVTFKNK